LRFSSTRPRPAGLAAILTALAVSAGVAFAAPAGAAPPTTDGGSAVTAAKTGALPPAAQLRQGRPAPGARSVPGGPLSQAVSFDGVCDRYANGTGELCLWWLLDFHGGLYDTFDDDATLFDNRFIVPAPGGGQVVANNTESVYNNDLVYTARVFTGVNYTGAHGTLAPAASGNLTSTFINNIESVEYI
jgi:Peptidase inhibitor family I36